MNIFLLPSDDFKVYCWICRLNNIDSFMENGKKWTINSPENIAANCSLDKNKVLKIIYKLKLKKLLYINEMHIKCVDKSQMALSACCFYGNTDIPKVAQ